MRSSVVFILVLLISGQHCEPIPVDWKNYIALYCPDKNNWTWKTTVTQKNIGGDDLLVLMKNGDAKDHVRFVEMDIKEIPGFTSYGSIHMKIRAEHTCTNDGSLKIKDYEYYVDLDHPLRYEYIALNLNDNSNTVAYEKLFVNHLKEECPTGDCSSIREQFSKSCEKPENESDRTDCKDGLEKAYSFCMDNKDSNNKICVPKLSSSSPSNSMSNSKTMYIIIGASVGIVVLVLVVGVFFYCRRKKKMQKAGQSGMTGTGTMSRTGTQTGTTKAGATGTITRTGQGSQGNNGTGTGTTTGGARY